MFLKNKCSKYNGEKSEIDHFQKITSQSKPSMFSHDIKVRGPNGSHMTYDSPTVLQWVQGFYKNILNEQERGECDKTIVYITDLTLDTTDFSKQGVKAAHAVLCHESKSSTRT